MVEGVKAVVEAVVVKEPAEEVVVVFAATFEVLVMVVLLVTSMVSVVESVNVRELPTQSYPWGQHASLPLPSIKQWLIGGQPRCF